MSTFDAAETTPYRIAVLISGGGTTLKNLLERIAAGTLPVEIAVVVSSSPSAGGLRYAEAAGIPTVIAERGKFASTTAFSEAVFAPCRERGVRLVVMGGWLKLLEVPADFAGRVVNIHPSLIPSFCGKGFYGLKVHQAVLDYGAKVTGCTIHFVDDQYDHGPILAQRTVEVLPDDTAEALQQRVFRVECEAYPEALAALAAGRVELHGRIVRIR